MKLKKLMLVFITFMLAILVVGCNTTTAEEDDLEKQLKNFILNGIDSLTNGMVLEEEVNFIYKIEWSISETPYARIGKTRDGKAKLFVTRPTSEEGTQGFTLTATISNITSTTGATFSKDFECYVRSLSSGVSNKNCNEIPYLGSGEEVTFSGVVTFIVENSGFWVKDDTGSIYVYENPANCDVAPGDIVTVTGTTSLYYTLMEIVDPTVDITTYGTSYNYRADAVTETVENLAKYNEEGVESVDTALRVNYGKVYQVTGTLIADANSGGRYKVGLKGTDEVSITLYDYTNMSETALKQLQDNVGKQVTIYVYWFDTYSSDPIFNRFIYIENSMTIK